MSNVEPTPPRPPQAYPVSTVQMAHATTDAVVTGLGKSPLMLGVVVLNVIGIAAAVYFLNLLISGQQQHLANLLTLQTAQLQEILTVHNHEFDALMETANRLSTVQNGTTLQVPTSPPPAQPAQRAR